MIDTTFTSNSRYIQITNPCKIPKFQCETIATQKRKQNQLATPKSPTKISPSIPEKCTSSV